MRIFLAAVILLFLLPISGLSQNWQSVFIVDSQIGYTTNTYLNPFLSEWDRNTDVGYSQISPLAQIAFSSNQFSSDITLGFAYKPFLDGRDAWLGLFGVINSRYKVADKVSLGLEAGGSRFNTFLTRDQYWLQPVLQWSPSLFTQVRFKAGSSFRSINDPDVAEDMETQRFDSYVLEFETWPSFRWQFRTSLFGNLDDPAANLGLRASMDYWATRSLKLSLNSGLERYQYQVMVDGGGGGPIGGPGGNMGEMFNESDRILRSGLGVSYQVFENIALSVQGDFLNYYSSITGEYLNDFHVSGGVRFSIKPKIGQRGKADVEWKQNDSQSVILRINHSGDGQLYILGDFNNWGSPGVALSRQSNNRYAAQLSLSPGIYEYKILLVDGDSETWIEFSEDTYTVSDGFGGVNGLIFIE